MTKEQIELKLRLHMAEICIAVFLKEGTLRVRECKDMLVEKVHELVIKAARPDADAQAEIDQLQTYLGIVLASLCDLEVATGELIDDEGGDIAGIEAELKSKSVTPA